MIAEKTKFRVDVAGDIFSPLVAILMEILWIYPWLVWSREMDIFPWNKTPLSFFSILGIFVGSFAVMRFIPVKKEWIRWLKLILIILITGTILNLEYGAGMLPFSGEWLRYMAQLVIDSFSTLHPAVPALIVSIYLAWRGIVLANSSTFSIDVFKSFLIGMIAEIVLIIVWTASMGENSGETLVSNAGLFIAGYFFFGLISLAMGNFLNIRMKLMRERSAPLSNGRWFTILLTVIGGMVVIGVGIAALFSRGLIANITSTIGNIMYYVNYAVALFFIPFQYVFNLVEAFLQWFVDVFGTDTIAQFVAPNMTDMLPNDEVQVVTKTGFDPMMLVKWLVFILLIAFVIWLLFRATRRFRSKEGSSGVEEFSESLWNWLDFRADIKLFFNRLFDAWFGSRIRKMRTGIPTVRRTPDVFPDDMNIREIYGHMLHETSSSGHARRSYETPYEFAKRLEGNLPDINDQVEGITSLYVNVRYGESTLKEWETEHANVLWRLMHRFFRKPKDKE